jgi:hypothetical protein
MGKGGGGKFEIRKSKGAGSDGARWREARILSAWNGPDWREIIQVCDFRADRSGTGHPFFNFRKLANFEFSPTFLALCENCSRDFSSGPG